MNGILKKKHNSFAHPSEVTEIPYALCNACCHQHLTDFLKLQPLKTLIYLMFTPVQTLTERLRRGMSLQYVVHLLVFPLSQYHYRETASVSSWADSWYSDFLGWGRSTERAALHQRGSEPLLAPTADSSPICNFLCFIYLLHNDPASKPRGLVFPSIVWRKKKQWQGCHFLSADRKSKSDTSVTLNAKFSLHAWAECLWTSHILIPISACVISAPLTHAKTHFPSACTAPRSPPPTSRFNQSNANPCQPLPPLQHCTGLGETTRRNGITHRLTVGLTGNLREVNETRSLDGFQKGVREESVQAFASLLSRRRPACRLHRGEDLASRCFDVCCYEFPKSRQSLSDCEKSSRLSLSAHHKLCLFSAC